MKRIIVSILMLFLTVCIAISIMTISRNNIDDNISSERNYYALLIGIEMSEGIEYPENNHIDETAIAMYEKLVNSSNWKKEDIKLLLNENATKENIRDAIVSWLDNKETEDDIVLYYFTGHSWKIPIIEMLKGTGYTYTYPYNTSDTKSSDEKVTDAELDSWLDELESRHVVVILDTCYSGRMLSLRQRDRVILTAGGKYLFCPVDEDDTLERVIFSHFLLQGFDGIADINNDGWVTAEEVFRYARMPTFYFSFWKQFPFIKYFPQLPFIYDCYSEQIPLIRLSSVKSTFHNK